MAGISKVNGRVAAGAFFGYTPIVVKVANTATFTADSIDGTTRVITEGGYAKATKVLQTFGTVVWQGAQTADSITVIMDQPTLNQGDGVGGNAGATTGFGALKAALATELSDTAANFRVTTSTTLNGAGTFTFA
jgi:hypothetical protein